MKRLCILKIGQNKGILEGRMLYKYLIWTCLGALVSSNTVFEGRIILVRLMDWKCIGFFCLFFNTRKEHSKSDRKLSFHWMPFKVISLNLVDMCGLAPTQGTDGTRFGSRCPMCSKYRGAGNADDPQDLPLCWCGFYEHHAGCAPHQGDHQRLQEH